MLIGKRYDKYNYNCAHYVADWYRVKLNIEIPVMNEFDRSFLVWMRRNFTTIIQPTDHCLVLMVEPSGDYHIGVYYKRDVYHNYKPPNKAGSVIKSKLNTVESQYQKVSFHQWSTSDITALPVVTISNSSG